MRSFRVHRDLVHVAYLMRIDDILEREARVPGHVAEERDTAEPQVLPHQTQSGTEEVLREERGCPNQKNVAPLLGPELLYQAGRGGQMPDVSICGQERFECAAGFGSGGTGDDPQLGFCGGERGERRQPGLVRLCHETAAMASCRKLCSSEESGGGVIVLRPRGALVGGEFGPDPCHQRREPFGEGPLGFISEQVLRGSDVDEAARTSPSLYCPVILGFGAPAMSATERAT